MDGDWASWIGIDRRRVGIEASRSESSVPTVRGCMAGVQGGARAVGGEGVIQKEEALKITLTMCFSDAIDSPSDFLREL